MDRWTQTGDMTFIPYKNKDIGQTVINSQNMEIGMLCFPVVFF